MSEHPNNMAFWINLLLLVFGSMVWCFNAYKTVTGLRTMGLLDGLSAGMCFFIGPFLLWECFNKARSLRR